MGQEKLSISSGIKHMPVFDGDMDTGRTVDFNPSDQGFAENLYGMVCKLQKIHDDCEKKYQAEQDPVARFEISMAMDQEMRESVDSIFGEGFCRDVFKVRLFSMADGMTVIENFLFALLDEMDASVTENLEKRDARIKKYTEKYSKYTKKYHN